MHLNRKHIQLAVILCCLWLFCMLLLRTCSSDQVAAAALQPQTFFEPQDEVVKKELHEQKTLFCLARNQRQKEVYCVTHAETVRQYKSGKQKIEESRDTVFIAIISSDLECPQSILSIPDGESANPKISSTNPRQRAQAVTP